MLSCTKCQLQQRERPQPKVCVSPGVRVPLPSWRAAWPLAENQRRHGRRTPRPPACRT